MNEDKAEIEALSVQLLALASRLEDDGQLNLAKLARSSAQALLVKAAWRSSHQPAAAAAEETLLEALSRAAMLMENPQLASLAQAGVSARQAGRLPLIADVPNPFVCRTCGHLRFGASGEDCPSCGARSPTFQEFLPTYWLTALDPFQALENLRSTPAAVAAMLEGKAPAALEQVPEPGAWNVRQILTHLRDAEGVLNFRLGLLLENENPLLEAAAVFEWAARDEDQPGGSQQILTEYVASRQKTLQMLESIQPNDWRRSGFHQEFGPVTVQQQASYFAVHEITHLPHLEETLRQ